MIPAMIASLRHFLGWMVTAFRSREDLVGNCWLCTPKDLAVD
jgi:hypothetical protein